MTVPTASTSSAGRNSRPACVAWPAVPAIRTATPRTAASRATGAGAKAATAPSGAGAMASSSDDQLTGRAATRYEMVTSWAAPASSSAPRSQGQLGGRGGEVRSQSAVTLGAAVGELLPPAVLSAVLLSVVIGASWRASAVISNSPTRLPGSPEVDATPGRAACQGPDLLELPHERLGQLCRATDAGVPVRPGRHADRQRVPARDRLAGGPVAGRHRPVGVADPPADRDERRAVRVGADARDGRPAVRAGHRVTPAGPRPRVPQAGRLGPPAARRGRSASRPDQQKRALGHRDERPAADRRAGAADARP